MYPTNLYGGKAFAAEKKIREFKTILLKKKKKRLKPNDLIKKAAENINNIISPKYDVAPEKNRAKEFKSKRWWIFWQTKK